MNKKFLVSAGPTYEKIDPVRFIGNYSSGKMGYSIAEELAVNGAQVILISGPVAVTAYNSNIKLIKVESAEEMYRECIKYFPGCDGAVMAAAVADFTPVNREIGKKKRGGKHISLQLKPTPDISATLGNMKTDNQLLVGFALETGNELDNAGEKRQRKKFNFIVLNSLRDEGAGFMSDTNKITIIDEGNNVQPFELKSKREAAKDIVKKMISLIK